MTTIDREEFNRVLASLEANAVMPHPESQCYLMFPHRRSIAGKEIARLAKVRRRQRKRMPKRLKQLYWRTRT